MVWLIIIGVVVLAFVLNGISKQQKQAEEKREFSEQAASRTEAYVHQLRRENTDGDFADLSEAELKDKVSTAIRTYNDEHKGLSGFVSFAVFVSGGLAYFVGGIARGGWGLGYYDFVRRFSCSL